MMSPEKAIQLLTDVEMLKLEVRGLNHVVVALTTLLCGLGPESAARTKRLLESMVPYANHMDSPPSGPVVEDVLRFTKALTESGADPALVLSVLALQGADAGPDRLSALADWHAQATEDELAQDIQQAIEKLGFPIAAPDGASKKQQD